MLSKTILFGSGILSDIDKRISPQPPSPAQLPLSNRYGALECEGPATEDVGEGEAPSRGLPRTSQTVPRITTASSKKKKEGHCHR